MKKIILFFSCCFFSFCSIGQEFQLNEKTEEVLDTLYREDQFYVGFTFNLLLNRPRGINSTGFSGGLHIGFIRDMPINKKRNFSMGLGLGYSINTYGQNLFIGEEENTEVTIFSSLKNIDFETNRFVTHLIEAPLEIRWRTSTPGNHKFWRVYTGVKIGYLYYFGSNYKQLPNIQIQQTKIDETLHF